jgi:hypothetical protein
MTAKIRSRAIGLAILAVWGAVLVAHARRDAATTPADRLAAGARMFAPVAHFYVVRMEGRAIGLAMSRLDTLPDGFVLEDRLQLDVPALGRVTRAVATTRIELDPALEVQAFRFQLEAPGGRYRVHAAAADGRWALELDAGAGVQRSTLPAEAGMLLAATLPLRLAAAGELVPGRTLRLRVFDPSVLAAREVEVRVVGEERAGVPRDSAVLDAGTGRWVAAGHDTLPVWRVEEAMGGVRVTSWVDRDGRIVRAESPLGFTMERVPFQVAWHELERSRGDPAFAAGYGAIVEGTAIQSAVPVRVVVGGESFAVRLAGVELDGFDLGGGRQELRGDTLVVVREDATGPAGYRLPWRGAGELAAALEASPLVQSDHPQIVRQARQVAGGERDPVMVAERLNQFVHRRLRKELSPGIPSAIQVLESGAGDCNEHTVLYVALARALGLPARTATGLARVDGRFFYHAWPEVWLGRWVAVDPTLGQFPADATHLRFVVGGLARQVELVRLIGRLRLEAP